MKPCKSWEKQITTLSIYQLVNGGFQPSTHIFWQNNYERFQAMMLAEMASDCGLPPGVLNVVHGGHDTVNFLCDNETRLH